MTATWSGRAWAPLKAVEEEYAYELLKEGLAGREYLR
jgi:hypothetical protein